MAAPAEQLQRHNCSHALTTAVYSILDPIGDFPRATGQISCIRSYSWMEGSWYVAAKIDIVVWRIRHLLPLTSLVDNDRAVLIRRIVPTTMASPGLP